MIKSVTVINHLGDVLELDLKNPEKSGFFIKSITGIGPGQGIINTTKDSINDGSIYNSARLEERNIVISLGFLWKDTIEDVRHLSYKFFPVKRNVMLIFETDSRVCSITGYIESNEPDIFSNESGCVISIICPDPYFYSFGNNGTSVTIFSGIEPIFEFEFENEGMADEIEFSNICNKTENVVSYYGDSEIGVTITIYAIGPATNITIYNSITREKMKIDTTKLESMTGQGIVARDEITICTVKGRKSITLLRDGKETNILNCLDKNSDWFQLSHGDNLFLFLAESGETNLQFRIVNNVIYEGV